MEIISKLLLWVGGNKTHDQSWCNRGRTYPSSLCLLHFHCRLGNYPFFHRTAPHKDIEGT